MTKNDVIVTDDDDFDQAPLLATYSFAEEVIHEAASLLWPPQTKANLHSIYARHLEGVAFAPDDGQQLSPMRCHDCSGALLAGLRDDTTCVASLSACRAMATHWHNAEQYEREAASLVRQLQWHFGTSGNGSGSGCRRKKRKA